MNESIVCKAIKIALEVSSWREAKRRIKNAGIELDALGMIDVVNAWQKNITSKYSDVMLASELKYWAEGGSFKEHLDGFDAIHPDNLIAEASIRNWQITKAPNNTSVLITPNQETIIVPKIL